MYINEITKEWMEERYGDMDIMQTPFVKSILAKSQERIKELEAICKQGHDKTLIAINNLKSQLKEKDKQYASYRKGAEEEIERLNIRLSIYDQSRKV